MKYSIKPQTKRAKLSAVAFGAASEAVGVLEPGFRVVGVNKGQFSLLDLMRAILAQCGPASVLVSTWTPGKREMNAVADMLDAHEITDFRLLIDRSFVTRHDDYVREIRSFLGEGAIRQTRTHAKFALISTDDYKITIRSSMNFNRNPRYEQFDIDDDPEIYAFFEGVVNELYEDAPAGFDAPRPEIEQAFRKAKLGALFRMDKAVSQNNELDGDSPMAIIARQMEEVLKKQLAGIGL